MPTFSAPFETTSVHSTYMRFEDILFSKTYIILHLKQSQEKTFFALADAFGHTHLG